MRSGDVKMDSMSPCARDECDERITAAGLASGFEYCSEECYETDVREHGVEDTKPKIEENADDVRQELYLT